MFSKKTLIRQGRKSPAVNNFSIVFAGSGRTRTPRVPYDVCLSFHCMYPDHLMVTCIPYYMMSNATRTYFEHMDQFFPMCFENMYVFNMFGNTAPGNASPGGEDLLFVVAVDNKNALKRPNTIKPCFSSQHTNQFFKDPLFKQGCKLPLVNSLSIVLAGSVRIRTLCVTYCVCLSLHASRPYCSVRLIVGSP